MTGDLFAPATADPNVEKRALATLLRIVEPGDDKVGAALDRLGPAELLEAVRAGDPGLPGGRGMRLRLAGVDPDAELEAARAVGARLIVRDSPDWPSQLDDLGSARPLALWVRGALDLRYALLRSVSIVGARTATPYGVRAATELAGGLGGRGWTVVSGAALGIDAAAHRGSLGQGGLTVAVLPGGLDVPYPLAHERLIEAIAECGVVVTEAGFGVRPARHRFLTRNRVIAALTRGTVVVEAAVRSGAATTARWTEQLGRTLMAVPGPVTSAMSVGTNELLRSRAAVAVTRAEEVVEDLGRIGDDLAPMRPSPSRPHDALPRRLARVVEALPARRPMPLAELARECGLEPEQAGAALGELALLGMVERVDGGWRPTRLGRGLAPAGRTAGGSR